MATLQSYIERMPASVSMRYRNNVRYWVGWANALLERMSGMGVLPPKWQSAVRPVIDNRWVDKPPLCRDVLSLHDPDHQAVTFAFEEINGRLRLYKRFVSRNGGGSDIRVTFAANPEIIAPGGSSELSWTVEEIPASGNILLKYLQAYQPIESAEDELEVGPYDNLIEAWLRWKAEEHEFVGSPDCQYWRERVDIELHQLRGEAFNRVNKPVGRRLIGFMR